MYNLLINQELFPVILANNVQTLEPCTEEYIENKKAEIRKYMLKAYNQYKNCNLENT